MQYHINGWTNVPKGIITVSTNNLSSNKKLHFFCFAFLRQTKERLPSPCDSGRSSPIFVSGYEAERQRNDIKQFGREAACKLAERRAEYAKRRMKQVQEETVIIEVMIGLELNLN